ncbi:TonB-dependent receptor plug domain-containing protein [Ferruginibacter sp.]
MKKRIFIAAAVIISSQLQAQDSTSRTLNQVIITANKTPQKQSTTGKVITVIGKDQIEKAVGKSVGQLLNEQAGLTINGALNNMGSNQSLYMRGAGSGRTLVLVDGIPVSDPSLINNEFDLNLISLNDVERIEICKGAQSTLYGSDAIAGVINIITVKSDINKPFNAKLTLDAGNLNTFKGNAQVFGKAKGLTYVVRYGKLKTDGFSAANDKTGTGNFDKDGYNSDVASGLLKYEINKNLSVKTYLQYSKYKTDLDAGVFADSKDYTSKNKSLMAGAGLQYKNDFVTITGNYQYSDITRNLLDDSTDNPGYLSRNDYFGKSQFVELYSSIKLSKNFTLLQGADYRNNNMNMVSFGTYPASIYGPAGTYGSKMDSTIGQASLYASVMYNGLKEKLNIDLGGRLNVNSRYGSNRTYSFNPSYKINEHVRLLGSISTAYKTPTIYQLYSAYGNRNLKVEESKSYELGVQVDCNKINNRLVYFYRDITNGIDYNNITNKYFNINSQIVRGLEYEVRYRPTEKLSISGNYTFISANEYSQSRINFKDTAYNYLLRRPKHSLNITVGYQFTPKLYVSIAGKYVSKRNDVGGYKTADISLPDYFIMNAYASYAINKQFTVFADAQNLTDRKFFDINGYNSIPLLFNGGITFKL